MTTTPDLHIFRDQNGTAHVEAATFDDMYWGQGFIHARDRGVQMLMMRILGQGRLCETLNDNETSLGIDKFFRQMNWHNNLSREFDKLEPKYQSYDEIDLAPYLRRGNNCIAALAHHFGESTFQSLERGGWGFLLDGEVRCRRGNPVPINSDDSWKGVRADAYNRRTSRYTVQLGFQEDFDAAKASPRWTAIGFNDRTWP